ncbi:MAG: heme ABC exporter ATP-binding protein CcmA [Acidimicrobiia bacterium]|nr:heme ABC exporter ATP-binding protein CcmA [Acidimicrobiia bacterium]
MDSFVVHLHAAVSLLGRFPALAGVDLDVRAGEVVLVQGPNGAGKTTLLRACAGLVPVVDGEATVLGHDLRRDRRAVRRHVALLGHATGLYDDLTVADNLHFIARAVRRSRAESASVPASVPVSLSVDDALARLGLAGRLASVQASRLSAGQRRRVAVAGLLLRPADLWLLDEPHAGLDSDGRDRLDRLVADAAGAGKTVLIASHELDRTRSLASRVVSMAGGQVRADAPAGVVGVA